MPFKCAAGKINNTAWIHGASLVQLSELEVVSFLLALGWIFLLQSCLVALEATWNSKPGCQTALPWLWAVCSLVKVLPMCHLNHDLKWVLNLALLGPISRCFCEIQKYKGCLKSENTLKSCCSRGQVFVVEHKSLDLLVWKVEQLPRNYCVFVRWMTSINWGRWSSLFWKGIRLFQF